MKKTIVLLLLLFSFGLKAQKLNTNFPVGQYVGKSRGFSNDITLNVIDKQHACITVRFDYPFLDDKEETSSYEYRTTFISKNDTLFFEQDNDTVPCLAYYTPNDVVSAADGNIQVQIRTSRIFEVFRVTIHPLKRGDSDEEPSDPDVNILDEGIMTVSCEANADDTLWIETSMGDYGFLIPEKVDTLYLVPNRPNLKLEYAYKGESVNELILKTDYYGDATAVFYKGNVAEVDLTKGKDELASMEHKTFIKTCKSVPVMSLNTAGYEGIDIYSEYKDEGSSFIKDTIYYTCSYEEALKVAKEKGLFVRVLYMKEGQCLGKYMERIRELNKEVYYYDNEFNQFKNYILAFLNEKEEKLVQRLGITKLNTDFILSPDEVLLYQNNITCEEGYLGISSFSFDENYLIEGLIFLYLDNVLSPQLAKNANNTAVLKQYLDKINQVINTSDYFSYDGSWESYINNQSNSFEHLGSVKIPSSGKIISYLNNYTKAKINAPLDTSLFKMIISFYNIIYSNEINTSISFYPFTYLMKHMEVFEHLQIHEHCKYKTFYQLIHKILTDPMLEYNNTYTQRDVLNLYREAIDLFPAHADYFYLLAYNVLNLSVVSPDFYTELLAFYKNHLMKLRDISDWESYMQSLEAQIGMFEVVYNDHSVYYPDKLYKVMSHLAWIIGVHEGVGGENIELALQCAQIASEQSDDYQYTTPNYAALLYLLGQKEKAIAIQKAYCQDKADSYVKYDQKMMYMLLMMMMDILEPHVVIGNY